MTNRYRVLLEQLGAGGLEVESAGHLHAVSKLVGEPFNSFVGYSTATRDHELLRNCSSNLETYAFSRVRRFLCLLTSPRRKECIYR